MTDTVFTKTYPAPAVDTGEILRYAGVRGDAPELDGILSACLDEARGTLTYKVCFCEVPVIHGEGSVTLGRVSTDSAALAKNLAGCDRAILFAATVGIGIDRLIARASATSPTRALIFQAIGAERIESLCDTFNREIVEEYASRGLFTRPRFSPGYGDFPITYQREIFALLDCPRRIGLTLNESMLMSPSKSVTAIIGVDGVGGVKTIKCGDCEGQDCGFRR